MEDRLLKRKPITSYLLPFIAASVMLMLLAAAGFGVRRGTVGNCKADLDNDGIAEEIFLTGVAGDVYGRELIVRKNGSEAGRFDLAAMKPWKVQVADIDGDGEPEISVGVYKTAKFHPVMAKRPFIYSWKDGKLSAKWLGSRLARPFDDYIFSDINADGRDELISIELMSNGNKVLNSYKWKGFGFEGMGGSREFEDMAKLGIAEDKDMDSGILADVKENGKWKSAGFCYVNGELEKASP